MRNSKVIREKIAEQREALDNLNELVKSENRDFTDEENTTWDEGMTELERLTSELEKVEKQEEVLKRAASVKAPMPTTLDTQKESKEEREVADKFSLLRSVQIAYGYDKLDGVEREMHQEAEKEQHALGQRTRGVLIPGMILNRAALTENSTTGIETTSFLDGVYANTILGNLGVTRLDSVTDQRIPIMPTFTTQWEGETDAAADGGSAITKDDLTPVRLASYADFSLQAKMQHNESIEQAIRRGFVEAVAAKVEYAIFTDDSGNGASAYLGNGKTAVTGATVTAMALALMEEVLGNNHNKGSLGFAVSHSLFAETWQAVLATGVSALVQDNMIMGLPTYFSTQIADIATGQETIYYGDWSKLFIAQFGGLDIYLDQATQRVSGKERLVINSFWDHSLAQDAAISVAGYTG